MKKTNTPFLLHLSNNESVIAKDIVGIFNMDKATQKKDTANFLKRAQKEMRTVAFSRSIPTSFVVCDNEDAETVYFSPISSTTLKNRLRNNNYDK